MENLKILIIDDHSLVRKGFKELLMRQEYVSDIIEAKNGKEALEKMKENPDIALLDINMPDMSGIEVLKKAKIKYPNQKIIMLTIHNAKEYVIEAMKNGADGYISKDANIDMLLDCIKNVHKGEYYLQPTLFAKLIKDNPMEVLQDIQNGRKTMMPLEELLSERELEVFTLIVEGLNNREISEKLFIKEKTVKNHITRLFKKINVKNRKQAIAWAKDYSKEHLP